MDNGEDPEEALCDDEKDSSTGSGTASLGSSFSSSQELRRMMRPPNKKKYEEEMEELQKLIRAKDAEMKALGSSSPEVNANQLREIRAEKEASISKRKKIDNDLRLLNQEITKKMGVLSRTESNLHYKNEAKIDDAIRKMQWQLETQNFRVAEERRIVAEIDKLRRSKKLLVEYMAQKNEVDKMRESQRRMRGERELYYRSVTNLSKREEELKRSTGQTKQKAEEIKKELDELYAKKKDLFSNFKQSETDYTRHMHERRHRLRKESFKKKEAEKKAREENWQKEMLEYESQREPFEDEKNLCNTLISYLQKWTNPDREREEAMLPSPREEQPPQPVGAGLADSLDGGKFVLLKKSEEVEEEYSLANKPRRRSKKGRKLSVTKPLAHTPQIIAQFASLNLYAPSNVSEVAASVEQLQARKRYYEEQAGMVQKPLIGNLSGSFSSSGSMSGSLDSPLRERSSTWGYVEVPPAIAESQTPSDAGNSAESGFHDMSRQASKTESSKSADECTQNDQALDEIIQQCECAASETSRSSSDTITPEDQICDDGDQSKAAGSSESCSSSQDTSQGNKGSVSDNQSVMSHDNDSAESLVFEESGSKVNFQTGELLRGSNSEQGETSVMNYDSDFPPGLRSDNQCISDLSSDKVPCDSIISYDSNQNTDNFWTATNTSDKTCDPVETLTIPVSNLVSDLNILSQVVQGIAETSLDDSCDIGESDTAKSQQKIAVTADSEVKVGDAQDESIDEVTHL